MDLTITDESPAVFNLSLHYALSKLDIEENIFLKMKQTDAYADDIVLTIKNKKYL